MKFTILWQGAIILTLASNVSSFSPQTTRRSLADPTLINSGEQDVLSAPVPFTETESIAGIEYDGDFLVGSEAERNEASRRVFLTTSLVGAMCFLAGMEEADARVVETSKEMALTSSSIVESEAATAAVEQAAAAIDWKAIFQKASKKALGGGKAGASAAVVQVCSLMWLRTSMNYQVRRSQQYGGAFSFIK
jgi:hypothetical protein